MKNGRRREHERAVRLRGHFVWCVGFALLTVLSAITHAGTVLVMKDGSGDATSIAGGVALAANGDSVLVGPGVYTEQVDINVSLTIVGRDGASSTTIDAAGGTHCLACPAENSSLVIDGFELIGASRGYGFESGFAIRGGGGGLEVHDCFIHDNANAILWTGDAFIGTSEFRNMAELFLSPIYITGGKASVVSCRFQQMNGAAVAGESVIVQDSEFTDFGMGSSRFAIGVDGPIVVENCLFFNTTSIGGIGVFTPAIALPKAAGRPTGGAWPVTSRGNTFVRVDGAAVEESPTVFVAEFSRNVVTGGALGFVRSGFIGGFGAIECNNVWGNGANWVGRPDPTGQDGNIGLPPHFCDSTNNNFFLAVNSPCLPANNSCQVLMGARDQGCGPTATAQESWGKIKSRYR